MFEKKYKLNMKLVNLIVINSIWTSKLTNIYIRFVIAVFISFITTIICLYNLYMCYDATSSITNFGIVTFLAIVLAYMGDNTDKYIALF